MAAQSFAIVRMAPDEKNALKAMAKAHHLSISDLIRLSLRETLKQGRVVVLDALPESTGPDPSLPLETRPCTHRKRGRPACVYTKSAI